MINLFSNNFPTKFVKMQEKKSSFEFYFQFKHACKKWDFLFVFFFLKSFYLFFSASYHPSNQKNRAFPGEKKEREKKKEKVGQRGKGVAACE